MRDRFSKATARTPALALVRMFQTTHCGRGTDRFGHFDDHLAGACADVQSGIEGRRGFSDLDQGPDARAVRRRRAATASRKDHRTVRGTVCLAFPDTYSLGMSHHGLQVLYSLMNEQGWACERAFTPLPDFEAGLREHDLPLYSLETFTPLNQFDVLGFTLQYEICYTNVLTMLDLGRHPAPRRGPRRRRHPGHRRRPRRSEPRAARAVHRPVRHRRRRAQPAGRLRAVDVR